MITAALYGTLGGLLGILVFIGAPMFAAMVDDQQRISKHYSGQLRFRVAEQYFTMSMKAYQRVIATISPHNDLELLASSWDRDTQAEQVERGDGTDEWTDTRGISARCRNVPFNLALSDKTQLIHPFDAHVGNALERIEQEGRRLMEFAVEGANGDQQTVRAHSAHANIPDSDAIHALDIQQARKTLPESHEPGDVKKTETHVENSQAGYNERDIVQMGIILMACFGGALAAWVIYSNTGSTESAVRLPVMAFPWWML